VAASVIRVREERLIGFSEKDREKPERERRERCQVRDREEV
jgi:hypothetical protein